MALCTYTDVLVLSPPPPRGVNDINFSVLKRMTIQV